MPEDGTHDWAGDGEQEMTSVLRVMDHNGDVMVDLKPNGDIEYGENYEPDEAARRFWEAVISQFPQLAYKFVEEHPKS